jgi:DNA-binding NtrC family response regulator
VVDDDPIVRDSLAALLREEGHDVQTACDAGEGRDHLRAGRFDLLITDVMLPGSDGMDLLTWTRREVPEVDVFVITAYGTIDSAVEAMKRGAMEYLTKPILDDDVRIAVLRALEQRALRAENRRLKQAMGQRYSFESILGQDPAFVRVFDVLDAAADSDATALITGESGTGKSLIARAIHANSSRREGPFVEVSCGALGESLLESELFGHVQGAFTHAVRDKDGKFAAADGGTIFLDEIGSASLAMQARLLRVLQERRFEPVGSNRTREVDVRVILATHRDLRREVVEGRFREDLFYRINVVTVDVPPLRRRVGDIPLLAEHFLERSARAHGRDVAGFTPEAMHLLQRHDWPGNVRELENCVERAVVLARQAMIGPEDLPDAVIADPPAGREQESPPGDLEPVGVLADGQTLEQAVAGSERRIIAAALAAHQGRRQDTADQLGINRVTLYKKMKKYGLM